MTIDLTRRGFARGLAAGAAALALARPGAARAQAQKMTVVGHQVHKLVLTEGAAGDVIGPWRQQASAEIEWVTLDLGAIHDRLFREASLRETQMALGFVLNARATPDAMGLFEPLEPFMGRAPIEDFADMSPGLVDAFRLKGAVTGIPFRQATSGIHYNEAIFEERGVKAPPRTIEELAEVARQVSFTRADGTRVSGFAFEAQNYSNVVNIARAWGGAFVTPDYKVATDQPAMIKALAMLQGFYKDGVLARNFAATTQEDMIAGMQDGRIAMVYFPFGRTTLFNNPERSRFAGRFKVIAPPVSADAASLGVKGAGITEFWSMAIPKNSRQKDLAWSFIRAVSTKEAGVKAAVNGNGPVRSSTFADPQVKAKVPWGDLEAETLRHTVAPLPPFEGAAQARDIFIEEMQLCVLGRQTPEQTGKNIAQRVAPLLPKI
jgi:multiple sugar transport system substrate-binding protein